MRSLSFAFLLLAVAVAGVAPFWQDAALAGPTGGINGVAYESQSGYMRGATVTLQPLGWQTMTSLIDGSFSFASVPNGSYTLQVTNPACTPFGCYKPTPVTVAGSKVFVSIFPNAFTPTPPPVGGVAELADGAGPISDAQEKTGRTGPLLPGLLAALGAASALLLGGAVWRGARRARR